MASPVPVAMLDQAERERRQEACDSIRRIERYLYRAKSEADGAAVATVDGMMRLAVGLRRRLDLWRANG